MGQTTQVFFLLCAVDVVLMINHSDYVIRYKLLISDDMNYLRGVIKYDDVNQSHIVMRE